MRVVLDSNVLIAALATRGLCSDILRFTITNYTLLNSEEIWLEIERTLRKKLKLTSVLINEFRDTLSDCAIWDTPAPASLQACRDRSDLHVLGLTHKANCLHLVSGDADLTVLKRYHETRILSPREFWCLTQGL